MASLFSCSQQQANVAEGLSLSTGHTQDDDPSPSGKVCDVNTCLLSTLRRLRIA